MDELQHSCNNDKAGCSSINYDFNNQISSFPSECQNRQIGQLMMQNQQLCNSNKAGCSSINYNFDNQISSFPSECQNRQIGQLMMQNQQLCNSNKAGCSSINYNFDNQISSFPSECQNRQIGQLMMQNQQLCNSNKAGCSNINYDFNNQMLSFPSECQNRQIGQLMMQNQQLCNSNKAGCSSINYNFDNQISSFPSECQNRQIGQLMMQNQQLCNSNKAGCSSINYNFDNQISSFPSECQNRQIGQLMMQNQQLCNSNKAGCSSINYNFDNQISSFPSECQNRQIGQLMMQNQQLCNSNKAGCSSINYNFDNQISSFPSECQNRQIGQLMMQNQQLCNSNKAGCSSINYNFDNQISSFPSECQNPFFSPRIYSEVSHLKGTSHLTYAQIKSKLEYKYSLLKSVSTEKFKDQCQTILSNTSTKNSIDPFENFIEKSHISLDSLAQNKLPNYDDRHGQWSQTDTKLLISVVKEGMSIGSILNERGEIMWNVVSQYMFGRDSLSCKNKWNHLKSKNDPRIVKITENKPAPDKSFHYNQYFNSVFNQEQEETLYQNIKELIDNNELVTMNTISEMAIDMYYSPICLAKKALDLCIYKNEEYQCNSKLPEFNDLLQLATDEPQQLMNKYNIRQFKASKCWVFRYMIRHNLSLRRVHYERRGIIDNEQIDRYLNQIVEAVIEVGIDRIVNMDETHVKTWNFPNRVVAEKGTETVRVEDNFFNDKEGTTFVGAVSMNPQKKFPLSIIAKGKTHRCEKKYEVFDKETQITHSESGWMTPKIMIQYLKWLKQRMNNQSFYLILDVYKAHIDNTVRKAAKKLQINLIFVPACGTGLYQPLDRRLFGLVKNYLTSHNLNKNLKKSDERWPNIVREMKLAWNNLSENAIRSSWDIPRLNELLISDDGDKDESDGEWLPDDYFIE